MAEETTKTKVGWQFINWGPLTPEEQNLLNADIQQNLFGYGDNILKQMIKARYQRIIEIVGNLKKEQSTNYGGLDAQGNELSIAALEPWHFADGTNMGQAWTQTTAVAFAWETHGFNGTPGVLTVVTVRNKWSHVIMGVADLALNGFIDVCMFRPKSTLNRRIRLYELGQLLPNNEWTPVMPIKTYTLLKSNTFDFRLLPNTALANVNIALLGVTCAPADLLNVETFTASLV